MLSRLRIGPKLWLAPGVVLVLLVVLSCGAYSAMVRQNRSLDLIVQQRAVHMRAADDLVASAQRAHAQAYQVLTWISGSFPDTRIDPLLRDLRSQQAAVERGFTGLLRQTAGHPEEARCVEQAHAAWRLYLPAVGDVIEIARHDQSISANAMSRAERGFAVVARRLLELAQREQALSEQASSGAAADFKRVSGLMPVVIALSIAASLAITMAVRRSLLAEIKAIEAAASGLASGDLTIRPRVYGGDEIGATARALDASIRNLNASLRTILDAARSIGSASREIALGRAGLPARAGVRDSLERTAASMQDLAAVMRGTADSAQEANRLAETASIAAQQGGDVVHRLVATLEQVRRTALRQDEVAAALEATLGRAGTLALNTALEASQAGAQGAGAAAAACELRGLAHQAADDARQARALAREALGTIEHGSAWAAQAGSSMADLASSVQEVGDIVNRIGSASRLRAHELAGVNQAIVRMDEMTTQGTRMVEDAALAARSLQQQALTLSRAVAAFRLDEALQGGADDAAQEKAPHGAGHPYLRLASSRARGQSKLS